VAQHIPPGSKIIIETAPDPNKKGDKNKKLPLWPFAVVGVVLITIIIIVVMVVRGLTRTTVVENTVQDPRTSAQKAAEQRNTADALATKLVNQASIEEARKGVAPAAPAPGASPSPQPGAAVAIKGYPYATTGGAGVPAGAAGTVPSQTAQASAGEAVKSGEAAQTTQAAPQPASSTGSAPRATRPRGLPDSAANTQQSFRYRPGGVAPRSGAGSPAESNGDRALNNYSFTERNGARDAGASAPVVPPFGTMLPVKTLGALYTLRASGFVRLELTRDMPGRGWTLPKGTVFVATLKASDVDRAFLSVVGYIDPRSNNLVRFGGDVLGQDGGAGLKGKRRVVGSAWLRAAGKVGASGLNLLQSALAGRNGGTTIVNGAQDPLAAELSGVQQRNQRREFVEVQAGTFGFVMVSDLPPDVDGQPPDFSNSEGQGGSGLLSDGEIAQLLTSGTPEQIRAALPRMSQNLRVVAESILKQ
jgi:hypothetical protein